VSLLVRLSLFSPHDCFLFFVCLCVSWGCATFQRFLSCPTQLGPAALTLYGWEAHALYQVLPISMRGLSNSEEIKCWVQKNWCLNELSRPVLGGYHSVINRIFRFENFSVSVIPSLNPPPNHRSHLYENQMNENRIKTHFKYWDPGAIKPITRVRFSKTDAQLLNKVVHLMHKVPRLNAQDSN